MYRNGIDNDCYRFIGVQTFTDSANGIPVKYEGYFQKENPKFEHDLKTEGGGGLSTTIRALNDEDLVKACGGRTAHK